MTLCHYSDILKIAAQLAGLDYSMEVGASGLSVSEERQLRVAISTQMQMLWPKGKWPGITRIEQREYRATYNSGTTYTAGTFVFFPQTLKYYQAVEPSFSGEAPADADDELNSAFWADAATEFSGDDYDATVAYEAGDIIYYPTTDTFYQCHTASTGNAPTNTSYWGALVPFDAYVDYEQTGETEIWEQGEIVVWDLNPRATSRAVEVPSFLSENGVQVNFSTAPARPWIEYKIRVPSLTGEVWDETETYAVGDQVQFETDSGKVPNINFYTCASATSAAESPTSAAAKWTRVELPDIFKNYLGAKAAVAFLMGDSDSRLQVAEAFAAEAESNLNDLLYRVQGQVPRTRVLTYS